MITICLDPVFGGLGQNIILCQHISAITVCYCSKCSYYSQYDYRLYDYLRYFLQYDMIGYYLFVCMIYVIVIFLG